MNNKVSDLAILLFCRLGVAGLSPVAPGTCGSFLALLAAPVLFFPLPLWSRIVLLGLLFWLGGLAATRAEKVLGKKDPSEVVIDELLGQWLTFLPFATPNWQACLLGFGLFRLFDACKPWPVSASETWLPSGFGVMVDDVVAGLMAMCCLLAVHYSGLLPLTIF